MSIAVECMDEQRWKQPQDLTAAFEALLNSPNLDWQELTDAINAVVQQHMLPMTPLPGSGYRTLGTHLLPEVVGDRKLNPSLSVQLLQELGRGTFGAVFDAEVVREGQAQPGVVKFSLKVEKEPAFFMEAFMQSVLYCVMQQDIVRPVRSARYPSMPRAPPLPNPIPRVLAPMEYVSDAPVRLTPALLMERGGTTFYNVLLGNTGAATLFLLTALLAAQLGTLQRLVDFRHADLHTSNVLVSETAPYNVRLEAEDEVLTTVADLMVSIIDFGFTCLQVRGKQLRTEYTPTYQKRLCDSNNAAADLFLFLGSSLSTCNQACAAAKPVDGDYYSFLRNTMRAEFLVGPQLRRQNGVWVTADNFGLYSQDNELLYTMAPAARFTTPEAVIADCIRGIAEEDDSSIFEPLNLAGLTSIEL